MGARDEMQSLIPKLPRTLKNRIIVSYSGTSYRGSPEKGRTEVKSGRKIIWLPF